jgi:two-component system, NarL family, sensor kinase
VHRPRVSSAIARFMLGSLAAIAVTVIGGFFVLRSIAVSEAERDTRARVQIEGRLVQAAGLSDRIFQRDPQALAHLDDVVQSQILGESVVRVKLWSPDGTILYSDEPALIGQRFQLGEEEEELFETGGADAELSDLEKPENRYERQEGKLLEAHTPIRTDKGRQVLFETYQRFSAVSASASRLLRALAPPLIGGVLVLLLFQVPLAYSLARRLQRGFDERERLLSSAIEASDLERRRIASDLHDGVVQDLAGVAFGLAPLADDARKRGDDESARVISDAVACLRQGVRDMRTLLVEIHPPRLETAGLEPVLDDLLSPLRLAGIETQLDVVDGGRADALVYRVVREALRNVREHAKAGRVSVTVTPRHAVVRDDGRGFDAAERARRREEGHVGLSLLEDLAMQSGGTLKIESAPGQGTTVTLELAP